MHAGVVTPGCDLFTRRPPHHIASFFLAQSVPWKGWAVCEVYWKPTACFGVSHDLLRKFWNCCAAECLIKSQPSDLDEVNVWMCDWRHGWGQTMLVQLLPALLTKQKCQKRVSVLVCVLSECWDNSKLVLPHFFLVMFGKGSHCISRDMALL